MTVMLPSEGEPLALFHEQGRSHYSYQPTAAVMYPDGTTVVLGQGVSWNSMGDDSLHAGWIGDQTKGVSMAVSKALRRTARKDHP